MRCLKQNKSRLKLKFAPYSGVRKLDPTIISSKYRQRIGSNFAQNFEGWCGLEISFFCNEYGRYQPIEGQWRIVWVYVRCTPFHTQQCTVYGPHPADVHTIPYPPLCAPPCLDQKTTTTCVSRTFNSAGQVPSTSTLHMYPPQVPSTCTLHEYPSHTKTETWNPSVIIMQTP